MLKSIFHVTSLGVFVQLLGFAKLLLVAEFYGVSAELDSYYLALVLPALLQGFVGGGLQSSFMPIYGALVTSGDTGGAKRLASQILTWMLLLLLPLCVLLAVASGWLIGLISTGAAEDVVTGASLAFAVLVFSFLLNVFLDYWGLLLNTHGRFALAAGAPVANILVSSIVIIVVGGSLSALVWGLVAGLLTQLLILWLFSCGHSLQLSKISLSALWDDKIKSVVSLFVPAMLGVAVTNMNFAVDQSMASGIETGSLSVLNYASRFHNLFVQVGIMGVSLVLLPRFVSLVSKKEYSVLFTLLRKVLIWSLVLSVFACLGIVFLGKGFLAVFMGFTSVDADAQSQIYWVWVWYSLGLFTTASSVFYVKLFQAWKMPVFITGLAVVSLMLNVLLNYIFIGWFGVEGIAMSTSLVYLIALLVYMGRAQMLKQNLSQLSV